MTLIATPRQTCDNLRVGLINAQWPCVKLGRTGPTCGNPEGYNALTVLTQGHWDQRLPRTFGGIRFTWLTLRDRNLSRANASNGARTHLPLGSETEWEESV